MTINAFDHYTIRAADLKASWRFYEKALGLRCEARAGASATAARIFIGDVEVVNLFQATPEQEAIFSRMAPPDAEAENWRTGGLQHVGFWATGIVAMRARLEDKGVPFRERTLPDKTPFVLKDPDGIEIEVNFPFSELTSGV